ncbi:uncharacterized protein LOC142345481 [Convolutriloba macropyga]|uniref:uncharacterized protein LOC142345481 n=1 Tax=Convolutriloba macropyga TaxID=536237 RepID=UPI003F52826E
MEFSIRHIAILAGVAVSCFVFSCLLMVILYFKKKKERKELERMRTKPPYRNSMNPEEFLEINAEAFRTPRTRVNNTLISIRDSAASHEYLHDYNRTYPSTSSRSDSHNMDRLTYNSTDNRERSTTLPHDGTFAMDFD